MDALNLRLPRNVASPGLARRRITTLLPNAPEQARDVAQVLVTELVTNALEHGAGAIDLSAHRHDNVLCIEVHDESPVFPQPGGPDPWAERGRGLHLVAQLADGWGVTEDPDGSGKTVWCNLQVDPARGGAFHFDDDIPAGSDLNR